MYVDTGTRIFTLADLRSVWVLLDAYELDVGFIRAGQEVEFEAEAFLGQAFKGRVSYVDPVLNASTRTVRVRLVVANPDLRLRPEMFVRARVKVEVGERGVVASNSLAGKWVCPMHLEVVQDGPGKCDKCGMDLEPAEKVEALGQPVSDEPVPPALAVPQAAVLLTGTRAVVYVETMKEDQPRYEGRVVDLGPRVGDYYIVDSGLSEGERVVTRGALMIDSALQIQAKPSMMQPATATAPEATTAEMEPAEAPKASGYVEGAMYHQHLAPVVEAYLALTAALAGEDAGKAAAAANDLRRGLQSAEPHGLTGEAVDLFKERVQAIRAALPAPDQTSIAALRDGLPTLSGAVEAYLRTFGHDRPHAVVKVFCPMAFDDKGASWLQVGETVNNPYFGKKMLRCGEVRGTIERDGEGGKPQ